MTRDESKHRGSAQCAKEHTWAATWTNVPAPRHTDAPVSTRLREHDVLPSAGWGVDGPMWWSDPRGAFQHLWDALNEQRGFGWIWNPWVWALTFRRVDKVGA